MKATMIVLHSESTVYIQLLNAVESIPDQGRNVDECSNITLQRPNMTLSNVLLNDCTIYWMQKLQQRIMS